MKNLKELRIVPLGETTFRIEGSWKDNENKASVTAEFDPAGISVARLMEIVEMTRKAGEDEMAQRRFKA